MAIVVRRIQADDVPEACEILNNIIHIGGTTAMQTPLNDLSFTQYYLGADQIACHVALDSDGLVAGFQWLGLNEKLPKDCADIATFTRRTNPLRGAGRALFGATSIAAKTAGFTQINATIRADNVPGLGYYSKMGFVDHSIARAVPLRDKTPVDRLSKRFTL